MMQALREYLSDDEIQAIKREYSASNPRYNGLSQELAVQKANSDLTDYIQLLLARYRKLPNVKLEEVEIVPVVQDYYNMRTALNTNIAECDGFRTRIVELESSLQIARQQLTNLSQVQTKNSVLEQEKAQLKARVQILGNLHSENAKLTAAIVKYETEINRLKALVQKLEGEISTQLVTIQELRAKIVDVKQSKEYKLLDREYKESAGKLIDLQKDLDASRQEAEEYKKKSRHQVQSVQQACPDLDDIKVAHGLEIRKLQHQLKKSNKRYHTTIVNSFVQNVLSNLNEVKKILSTGDYREATYRIDQIVQLLDNYIKQTLRDVDTQPDEIFEQVDLLIKNVGHSINGMIQDLAISVDNEEKGEYMNAINVLVVRIIAFQQQIVPKEVVGDNFSIIIDEYDKLLTDYSIEGFAVWIGHFAYYAKNKVIRGHGLITTENAIQWLSFVPWIVILILIVLVVLYMLFIAPKVNNCTRKCSSLSIDTECT